MVRIADEGHQRPMHTTAAPASGGAFPSRSDSPAPHHPLLMSILQVESLQSCVKFNVRPKTEFVQSQQCVARKRDRTPLVRPRNFRKHSKRHHFGSPDLLPADLGECDGWSSTPGIHSEHLLGGGEVPRVGNKRDGNCYLSKEIETSWTMF